MARKQYHYEPEHMENREHNDQRANIQNQENAAQKVTRIGLANKTNRKYVSTRSGGDRKA